jgi:hypothetical protein
VQADYERVLTDSATNLVNLKKRLGWDSNGGAFDPRKILSMTEDEALALRESDQDKGASTWFKARDRPDDRVVVLNDFPMSLPAGTWAQSSFSFWQTFSGCIPFIFTFFGR